MAPALDSQRTLRQVRRTTWVPLSDDEFLMIAFHQLFMNIEAARAGGAVITSRGSVLLSEISSCVLRYLGAPETGYERIPNTSTRSSSVVDPEKDSPEQKTQLCDIDYPEGGSEAWLVVFGSWCGLFCSIGILNIMGTIQNHISQNQLKDYDEATIGWIFSLHAFLAFFCGVFIGPKFDKYGPRWLTRAGSVCIVANMMLLGLCTEFWHFIICFGVLGGIGTALMFSPCIAAVGHYFKVSRGLATGIAFTSAALNGIIFPLMFQQLVPDIGFAWTTRTLGCIYAVLCGIAVLLVKSRLPPIEGSTSGPDLRIFQRTCFTLTVAGLFLLEWAILVPLAYITSYASSQGFSLALSYDILTFLNTGSLLGRLIPGYMADRIGRYNTNILVILIAILSTLAIWLPWGSSYYALTAFAFLFGFASGCNITLGPVCLGDLCRTEEYGRYYATSSTAISFAALTGIPIAGNVMKAAGGSYAGLIIFTGVCYVGGLCAFLAARLLATGWKWNSKY